MAMKLKQVVPFGRSFDEYREMFSLTSGDFSRKILGVGDGPASFNSEMTKLGHRVVSIDPLYSFTGQEIERKFYEMVDGIIEQVKATPSDWVWIYHRSPEDLRQNRIMALHLFLADYEQGKVQMRYLVGELPHLSEIADEAFDMALCSHFLFLYSNQFWLDFHRVAILEMLRVATEVRIFPLLTLKGVRSAYVDPVMQDLLQQGYEVEILRVTYELQRGGNEMLRVSRR
ncbi:MAG: SAM-dependent methyltransferase [Nitrospirales bacterium]